jgi:type I restriction enzyme, S subunit
MSSEWKIVKLSDCTIDGNISYGIVQPGVHDINGVPILRINNIKNGELDLNEVLKVSTEIDRNYSKTKLEGGEVLLTLVGSTGQSLIVPKELNGWNVPRAIAVIRPNKTAGSKWINICLQTKEVRDFLDARANTTVQKTLNLKDVKEVPILLPPLHIKMQIENIYYTLNNKILINNKINHTLETIAQTLFKSWFVDFDPVKAKIAAKAQGQDPQLGAMMAISGKTAEQIAQLPEDKRNELAATADLFPDEMVESELGIIPRGWKVDNLSSVTTQIKRGITPKYIEDDGVIVLNQKCIRNHTLNFEFARRHNNKLKSINDSFVEIGDILVNSTGVGTLGRVAIVRRLPEKTIIDTHVTVVRADEDKINKTYLGINLLGREMEIESLAEGTTGQTELKRSLLEVLPLMTPQKDLQNIFAQILTPQLEYYAKNEKENSTLIQIRDTLVPRLLSGEIEIQ